MNAGATEVNGDTVLLCRVEDRRGSATSPSPALRTVSRTGSSSSPLLEPEPGVSTTHGASRTPGSPGSPSSTAG